MSDENPRNGTGNSIVAVHSVTAAIADTRTIHTDPDLGYARGVISASTGTVNVTLFAQPIATLIPVFEGKDCLFNITSIIAGGSVPLADLTLIW